jgi:hypothetical protein
VKERALDDASWEGFDELRAEFFEALKMLRDDWLTRIDSRPVSGPAGGVVESGSS